MQYQYNIQQTQEGQSKMATPLNHKDSTAARSFTSLVHALESRQVRLMDTEDALQFLSCQRLVPETRIVTDAQTYDP